MHMTGFKCVQCEAEQPKNFGRFVCPSCGGNLDVMYDYDAIRAGLDHEYPFPSDRQDIFKYLPLLPLNDVALAPPLRIGATPLYRASRLGASVGLKNLYVKDDGLNPSASFKDRASSVTLTKARELGAKFVAGASTGNAGSSMACMSASVGAPCVIFVPEKAPAAKIAQLLIFGAQVIAVRGTYDDAFDLCYRFCEKHHWFNRNTGFNPYTREGKKTCSFEVCEQLNWEAPDWIAVSSGDGNILSGIWKGLKDLHRVGLIKKLPRLICAQSEQSSAIAQTVGNVRKSWHGEAPVDWKQVKVVNVQATTVADSISVDIPRDGIAAVRAVIESDGAAVTVPDSDIIAAIPELARQAGVFSEPAAACTWACVKKAARESVIGPDETVVCVLTGSGLKDIAGALKAVGEPVKIDPTVEAAEKALKI